MRRRTIYDLCISLMMLLIPLAAVIAFKIHTYSKLTPRHETFSEHLTTMPEPVDYQLIKVRGKEYLAVHGPLPSLWAFPSGPPVYMFEKSGKLVDSTSDAGDDESFHSRWPGVYGGKQLTSAEAEQWSAIKP